MTEISNGPRRETVRPFLIGGEAKEHGIYDNLPGVHFVFCHACGSGKTGTLPPWHPHLPPLWECFECGAKFGVHKAAALSARSP